MTRRKPTRRQAEALARRVLLLKDTQPEEFKVVLKVIGLLAKKARARRAAKP